MREKIRETRGRRLAGLSGIRVLAALCLCLLFLTAMPAGGSRVLYAKQRTGHKNSAKTAGEKIKLNRTEVMIASGKSVKLEVSGTQAAVRWTVRNKKVATVRRTGKRAAVVGGVGAGTTTVTAKIGKRKLECMVTVSDLSLSGWNRTILWTEAWKNGTWEKDGYHDASGELLADMEQALTCKNNTVKKAAKRPILYIGASRTKNTADSVIDKKVFFYYCGGAGFRWFFNPTYHYGKRIEPAFQVIRTYLTKRPDGTVIIDLGGNDLSNIDAYVGFYRQLMEMYPQAKFWFMGILPRARSNSTNPERKAFNERLMKEFPDHTIDLYDWVFSFRDFKTTDGIHYGKKLSRRIYKKTMEMIGRKIKIAEKTGKVR